MSKSIKRFEEAVRAHEMRGAQRPEDVPAIENEYIESKNELIQLHADLHAKITQLQSDLRQANSFESWRQSANHASRSGGTL